MKGQCLNEIFDNTSVLIKVRVSFMSNNLPTQESKKSIGITEREDVTLRERNNIIQIFMYLERRATKYFMSCLKTNEYNGKLVMMHID